VPDDRFEEGYSMARATIVFGVGLIVLGIVGYVATAAISFTALIPAIFGVAFVALGSLAHRKHAVHLAAALAVIGLFGALPGLLGLFELISGAEVQRPAAAVSQSVMAILMAVYVGLCMRVFMRARRARITRPV
jgi:hypothetical protein